MEATFLLVAGFLFAWRLSKAKLEPDGGLFYLWAFLGAMPYRDHPAMKPPGIYVWHKIIVTLVGKNIRRAKFTHHMLLNLGSLIALYAWGLPAALTWLVLINAIHFSAFCGNAEAPCALFLMIALATPNPWAKVIAFSIACFFQHKVFPMGIILWPHIPQALVVLGLWMAGFAVFWKWKPEIARPVIRAMTIEPNRIRMGRMSARDWFKSQWLGNDTHWQGLGITILWGGLAIYNRPDPLFWLPCILYTLLTLTGKVWRPYYWTIFIPWIAIAIPNVLPLLLLISLAQLAWDSFYLQDIFFLAYRGLHEEVHLSEALGKRMRGKKFWVNGWFHSLYIYADCYPKYGAEIPGCHGGAWREWYSERNRRLKKDVPDWIIETGGRTDAVNVTSRVIQKIGPWKVYQMR